MFKCVGGDLMEKTLKDAAQLLQKVSKVAAMRRDMETRLSGRSEHDSCMRTHAEISKEAALKDMKREPIPKKLEGVHVETRTTSSINFAKSCKTNERSMSSMKSIREFEQMDCVPIVL
jgi:hypothetical protein